MAAAPDVGVSGGLESLRVEPGQGAGEASGTRGSAAAADGTDVGAVLAERGKRYGRFEQHAHIAQSLKQFMAQTAGWDRLSADQREALDMIQHKIARVLNGSPEYSDNWIDIAGYATLVAKRLEGVSL